MIHGSGKDLEKNNQLRRGGKNKKKKKSSLREREREGGRDSRFANKTKHEFDRKPTVSFLDSVCLFRPPRSDDLLEGKNQDRKVFFSRPISFNLISSHQNQERPIYEFPSLTNVSDFFWRNKRGHRTAPVLRSGKQIDKNLGGNSIKTHIYIYMYSLCDHRLFEQREEPGGGKKKTIENHF